MTEAERNDFILDVIAGLQQQIDIKNTVIDELLRKNCDISSDLDDTENELGRAILENQRMNNESAQLHTKINALNTVLNAESVTLTRDE